MNSRERVKRCLEFDHPDRAPRDLWAMPWAEWNYPAEIASIRKDFPTDFGGAPGPLSQPLRTEGDPHKPGRYVDEWGCTFENIQEGAIGEVKHPLVEDWDRDLEKVHIPRELLSFDREAANAYCRGTDLFVRAGVCPRPFEQLQFIRRTENLYLDLVEQPAGFIRFIGMMHEFYKELLDEWSKTEVDALNFMDDWGAQNALLIHPRTWRKFFKPMYKDYVDIAHSRGKKIFMHSDGYILDIYPDLIEIGVDAVNSQVFCMGIDKLEAFKGKITFWGEIDRQHLLPNGTQQEIREAVRHFHQTLSLNNGGVIAQCEFGLAARPENVREVYRAWDEVSGK